MLWGFNFVPIRWALDAVGEKLTLIEVAARLIILLGLAIALVPGARLRRRPTGPSAD